MVLRVLRFTGSERAVHWLTAAAFVSLLASGLLVGRSGSFHNLMYGWHLISAGALVGGILLGIAAGNRRALGGAASELVRLTADDRSWLAHAPAHLLAGDPEPSTGRFNGGQKLNFLLVCLLLAMLFLTGINAIVEGRHHNLVFAGHKLATIAACGLVGAHMYMAVVNRGTRNALRGIATGEVDRAWAEKHYPQWTAAQLAPASTAQAAGHNRDCPGQPLLAARASDRSASKRPWAGTSR